VNRHEELEALFVRHGYTEFRWVQPGNIATGLWVRLKCMFGCPGYARNAACPPNVPGVAECRQFFDEYTLAAIFRFEKTLADPEERNAWSREVNEALLKLERDVFLLDYPKAFLLFMDSCGICAECAGQRVECLDPASARPTPEAMAVDVFTTVRRCGFPIAVVQDYDKPMNRYAILLID
jgi:predicted metal-binding protein